MSKRFERDLNRFLIRDLNNFIDITEAKIENRKELIRAILSAIAMIVAFGILVLTAISLEQPDVPSKQKVAKEVNI